MNTHIKSHIARKKVLLFFQLSNYFKNKKKDLNVLLCVLAVEYLVTVPMLQ